MNDWKTVRLGDVCEQIRGVSYKPADLHNELDDNSVILLRANNIFGDALNYDELVYVDNKKVFDSQYLKKGDILICASSGSKNLVGKAACLEEDRKLTFGAFCKVLRTDSVNHGFFKHYFFSPSYRSTISSLSAGANINNIRAEDLDNLLIPLPPLEEQKHIAAVLDKCTALIAKHKRMLEKYDTLVKSRFIEMFGDPVQNSKGYKYKKLEELGKWESGGTPSRKNNDYFKGSIPWYSAGELNSLYLYDSNEKITETAIEESSAKLFRKGSLFVGMYDTAAFKMGIATTDCSSNQACANIFPNRDVNVIWLYYELMEMKEFFLQNRRGVRQKNLNLGMIKGFEIPYAPSNLQNDFAAFVQQIDKSKFAVQKSLEKAETLYKSLMQKYFN